MIKIIIDLLKSILGTGNHIARNRLLNKHTSKGILMLSTAGYLFDVIDEQKLNVIISILAGSSIGYSDIYLFLFNCLIIYSVYKGIVLILKRAEKWVDEASFKDNNPQKSNSINSQAEESEVKKEN